MGGETTQSSSTHDEAAEALDALATLGGDRPPKWFTDALRRMGVDLAAVEYDPLFMDERATGPAYTYKTSHGEIIRARNAASARNELS